MALRNPFLFLISYKKLCKTIDFFDRVFLLITKYPSGKSTLNTVCKIYSLKIYVFISFHSLFYLYLYFNLLILLRRLNSQCKP